MRDLAGGTTLLTRGEIDPYRAWCRRRNADLSAIAALSRRTPEDVPDDKNNEEA